MDREQELLDKITEIATDGRMLAAAIRDVVYQGRRAERKLWMEYRGDDRFNPDVKDDMESWAEGEALRDALDSLEELIGWERSSQIPGRKA